MGAPGLYLSCWYKTNASLLWLFCHRLPSQFPRLSMALFEFQLQLFDCHSKTEEIEKTMLSFPFWKIQPMSGHIYRNLKSALSWMGPINRASNPIQNISFSLAIQYILIPIFIHTHLSLQVLTFYKKKCKFIEWNIIHLSISMPPNKLS